MKPLIRHLQRRWLSEFFVPYIPAAVSRSDNINLPTDNTLGNRGHYDNSRWPWYYNGVYWPYVNHIEPQHIWEGDQVLRCSYYNVPQYDLEHYTAVLWYLQHRSRFGPWSDFSTELELLEGNFSKWNARLATADATCANRTNHGSSRDGCGTQQKKISATKIIEVLQGYCNNKTLFHNSCDAPSFLSQTTFECKPMHRQAQVALGAVWVAFGAVIVIAMLVVEFLWSFSGGLQAALARRPCLVRRGWTSCCWLGRMPVSYHPTPVVQVAVCGTAGLPCRSGSASKWMVFFSAVNRCMLAIAYVVDIALDIWTLAALFEFDEQDTQISRDVRSRYGAFLLIVFLTQYLVGAFLAAPAVLVTHGLLNYAWFKQPSRTVRVLLLLPPVWVLLASAVAFYILLILLVGLWYLLVADLNMLLSLCGVPDHLLLGNRLNMKAIMVLRFMCEGIVEALPSALISTAYINVQINARQTEGLKVLVFWLSLVSSLTRVARELYKLLRLTYDLHASCFITAIVDVCYHLQPHQRTMNLPMVANNSADLTPCAAQGSRTSLSPDVEGGAADTAAEAGMQQTCSADQHVLQERMSESDGKIHSQSKAADAVGSADVIGDRTGSRVCGTASQQSAAFNVAASSRTNNARGCCCWCHGGSSEGNGLQHPRALVVYVWVVLSLISSGVAVLCLFVICPLLLQGDCSSADSLTSVWPSFTGTVVELGPEDALACLVEKNATPST